MVNTRRDRHGRLLAPSRVNRRAEIVVAAPAGEQLSEERMIALGVDPNAPARGPDAQAQPAGDGGQGQSDESTQSYPIPTGSGWYQLSTGEKVQGENDALERQDEIDEAAK